MTRLTLIWCLLIASLSYAQSDTSRIQNIEYGRKVMALTLAEGVSTTIELPADDAVVKPPLLGDGKAWHVTYEGNLVALKPSAPNASTNLTIFGRQRAYLFRLDALAADTWYVPYWVTITLPVELTSAPPTTTAKPSTSITLNPQQKAQRANAMIEREFGLSPYRGKINFDYWAQGARALQPIAAHDNGTHTYLTFAEGLPFPSVFVYDQDGNETTVSFHVERGNTLVIHRVTDRILLRRGQSVTGITNAAYAPSQIPNPAGTITPFIERIVKPADTRGTP